MPSLLEHERREVHDPVEAPEGVSGREHRQELVGDLLLAGLEADGDGGDPGALGLRHAVPVGCVLVVVEQLRVPDLPRRLLVLAVDRPGHDLRVEPKTRLDRAKLSNTGHAVLLSGPGRR